MTALRMIIASIGIGVGVSTAFAQTADIIREHFGSPDPEFDFEQGVSIRHDALRSQSCFRDAAKLFDRDWIDPRQQSRTLALNRGRAHYLAGNLPQAVRAFRDGLELDPWNAELQHGLAICWAAVEYPTESDPTERIRPDPHSTLQHLSPTDLLLLSVLASGLTALGLARRFTASDSWSVPVAGLGLAGLFAIGTVFFLMERDRRHDRDQPIVVVAETATLRTGNGPTFAPRITASIPRGAEVRELARRGGWVQVELPGGAVGWLPEPAILGKQGITR